MSEDLHLFTLSHSCSVPMQWRLSFWTLCSFVSIALRDGATGTVSNHHTGNELPYSGCCFCANFYFLLFFFVFSVFCFMRSRKEALGTSGAAFFKLDFLSFHPAVSVKALKGACGRLWLYNIVVYMPSVLWRCWLGGRKGIQPVKNSRGGVLSWLSVWSEVQTCIWPSWCHCHSLSCFSKIQIGFTFLVPAHLGSPRKRAVKWVCVVYVWIFLQSSVGDQSAARTSESEQCRWWWHSSTQPDEPHVYASFSRQQCRCWSQSHSAGPETPCQQILAGDFTLSGPFSSNCIVYILLLCVLCTCLCAHLAVYCMLYCDPSNLVLGPPRC